MESNATIWADVATKTVHMVITGANAAVVGAPAISIDREQQVVLKTVQIRWDAAMGTARISMSIFGEDNF